MAPLVLALRSKLSRRYTAPGKRSPQRHAGVRGSRLEPARTGADPAGQGKIEFGEAKLDTLWPGAIPLAVDAAIKAEPDKLAAVVRRGLASGLSTGNLPLGQ